MYVLSDHYIILRKSNRDGGVVRLHVNVGYFCLPHQSRVPHLHVNRSLHSKGVIKDCTIELLSTVNPLLSPPPPPPQTHPSQISPLSLISLSYSGEES